MSNETLHLSVAWISSCGDKDCRFQVAPSLIIQSRILLHSQLIERHGIVGTLEDIYMLCIFQVCSFGTGYPYSFTGIATCCHSFTGCAVLMRIASFLKTHATVWLPRNVHGKGEVLIHVAILSCSRSEQETVMKGTSCSKIYPS